MGIGRGGLRTRPFFFLVIPLVLFLPLFFSVAQLRRDRESVARKPSDKSDHLILGPAAGQGLPNRLQCQGLKAINELHSSRSHLNVSNGDYAVSFVTVFTIYNASLGRGSPADTVTVGKASMSKTERSMAVLNTFVDFIQNAAGFDANQQRNHIDRSSFQFLNKQKVNYNFTHSRRLFPRTADASEDQVVHFLFGITAG